MSCNIVECHVLTADVHITVLPPSVRVGCIAPRAARFIVRVPAEILRVSQSLFREVARVCLAVGVGRLGVPGLAGLTTACSGDLTTVLHTIVSKFTVHTGL